MKRTTAPGLVITQQRAPRTRMGTECEAGHSLLNERERQWRRGRRRTECEAEVKATALKLRVDLKCQHRPSRTGAGS